MVLTVAAIFLCQLKALALDCIDRPHMGPVSIYNFHVLANIEEVRWVCNPWGRCWWRPSFYGAYAYYPARPVYYFGRPWWHRHWHYRW
jgi:hypothetical protein